MIDDDDDDGIFEESTSDDPRYSAVFEDDGEVAFGYLLLNGDIIADVWLYNHESRFVPVSESQEVSIAWSYGEDRLPVTVEFWIRGNLHARISREPKSSWCVLAAGAGA